MEGLGYQLVSEESLHTDYQDPQTTLSYMPAFEKTMPFANYDVCSTLAFFGSTKPSKVTFFSSFIIKSILSHALILIPSRAMSVPTICLQQFEAWKTSKVLTVDFFAGPTYFAAQARVTFPQLFHQAGYITNAATCPTIASLQSKRF